MTTKLIAAAIAATAAFAAPAYAGINVVDGDTIKIDGRTIRIVEIDTPEFYRPRCEAELVKALEAKERLRLLLDSGKVTFKSTGRDLYGRTLAKVFAGDTNVGTVLIKEGYALPYQPGAASKLNRLQAWCGPSATLEDVWRGSVKPLTVVAARKKHSDEQGEVSRPFPNCAAARAAGAAPVYAGDPGYQPKLDRDHDGVGCE
ncbi:endonuclease YncB(thermonuclease family) [Pararhizobium capsulatum DSM 1112]|uniref:Endonuclease YncB(Thermonuclease family) n=1 Tax=Pararhizobium capsulatum DSM 1112 TaxID=1121113 RepID=A0ABU0C1P8_9HYPH|nr:excalibur calcium-binding domain-containing protein [Pararhizobium capsulatum]MDQ0323826.1 endonuclease YncB(thermonuclease family) [Pararhizobium capsulatum DSM 1112]